MPLEISLLQFRLISSQISSPVDGDGLIFMEMHLDLQILLGNILIYNRESKLQSFIVLLNPGAVKTCQEHADTLSLSYVSQQLSLAKRVDVV